MFSIAQRKSGVIRRRPESALGFQLVAAKDPLFLWGKPTLLVRRVIYERLRMSRSVNCRAFSLLTTITGNGSRSNLLFYSR